MVHTHPDTKDKILYLGCHVSHIHGMPRAESDTLLAELMEHTTQPQFVYAHQWQQWDLVIWDNRCSLHAAVYDQGDQPRTLYRVMCEGEVPFEDE